MNATDLFEAGCSHLSKGRPIVPCNGKVPCDERGFPLGNWQSIDTTKERLEAGLLGATEPTIGLRLGPNSAIDIETDSNEEVEAVQHLFRDCEQPLTPSYKSPRGKHMLFRWDDRLEAIGKGIASYSTPDGKRVQIRIGASGKGAQSILPPSAGREWLPGQSMEECELAGLPEVVIDRLIACGCNLNPKAIAKFSPAEVASDSTANVLAAMLRHKPSKGESDGSRRLVRICCRALECDVDDATALTAIRQYAAIHPFPRQWTDTEILQRLRDAESMAERGKSIPASNQPEIIRLADVEPQPLEWLWRNRIPLGKLTLLVGDPDVGKSLCSLEIASRVTRGEAWPDASGESQPIGGVILLSAEDDRADTILPRLSSHRADISRIALLASICSEINGGTRRRGFDLGRDVDALAKAIDSIEGCRLVIIDPISAYMGKADSHVNADVRSVLAPLAELAATKRVAVVAINHLRKGESAAMYRSMGSMAFVAAARATWLVCRDGDRRLLLPIKHNLASDKVKGLAFNIEGHGLDGPVVRWLPDQIESTADEVLSRPPAKRGPKPEALVQAREYLEETIKDSPRPTAEVVSEAGGLGIKRRTLSRAAKGIGVVTKREGFGAASTWALPA